MKVRYDFNLSLWMKGVEVEGRDKEDCYDNFCKLSVEDLIEKGYVKDMEVQDLNEEIISEEVTYKISNIEWEEEAPEDLPIEGEVKVIIEEGEDEEDIITDVIRNELGEGYWPILFDYDRI